MSKKYPLPSSALLAQKKIINMKTNHTNKKILLPAALSAAAFAFLGLAPQQVQGHPYVIHAPKRYKTIGRSFSADENSSCQDPVGAWDQCGGGDFDGSTCCIDGFQCEEMAECYFECRPQENGSTSPELPTGVDNSCQEPVGAWGQCGGRHFDGSTCCIDGYQCEESGEYYSQCRPEEDSTVDETEKPCQDPVEGWEQCGGKEFDGPTCCIDGFQCQKSGEYYSQCRPQEDEPSSFCHDPVGAWGQCGGKEFHGSTCCIDGYRCEESREFYSQCVLQEDEPSSSCHDPVGAWGQCGGKTFHGSTCCIDGYRCEESGEFYSQCRPQEHEPSSSCHDPVGAWGQCGGKIFNGSTCCTDGYRCEEFGEFYSQCRPQRDEEVDPSPAPTTPPPQPTQPPQPTPPPQPTQTQEPQEPGTGIFYRPVHGQIVEAFAQIDDLEADGRHKDAGKIRVMIGQPTAVWIIEGSPSSDDGGANRQVQQHMEEASRLGQIPVFALYYLPFRDCTQYSAGGATSAEEYGKWVESAASAIGNDDAYVLLEPDGLAIIPHATNIDGGLDWCQPQKADPAVAEEERYAMTVNAIAVLKANPRTRVYLDGSHANWLAPNEMASRLVRANVQDADGFFLNVSYYVKTDLQIGYGERVAKCVFWGLEGNDMSVCTDDDAFYAENVDPLIQEVGDDAVPHFVIDTSRNGNGIWTPDRDYPDAMQWCNPPTATLGQPATTDTDSPYADAYLWIKVPGESDGACDRGLTDQGGVDPEWGMVDPTAGSWFPEQVEVLVGATGE